MSRKRRGRPKSYRKHKSRSRGSAFKIKLKSSSIRSISSVLLLSAALLTLLSYVGQSIGPDNILQDLLNRYFGPLNFNYFWSLFNRSEVGIFPGECLGRSYHFPNCFYFSNFSLPKCYRNKRRRNNRTICSFKIKHSIFESGSYYPNFNRAFCFFTDYFRCLFNGNFEYDRKYFSRVF